MPGLKFPFLFKQSTLALYREARRTKDYSWFDFLHGLVYGKWVYLYISIGKGQHPLARRYRKLSQKAYALFDRLITRPPAKPEPHKEPSETVTFADTYHGKVVPLQAARQLVMVNQPVQLPNLEQVIPYKRARDIVLQNPDHIVVLDCPCRSAMPDPCLPLDVCLVVGEPFAGFIREHHPDRSRWISPDEAVAILEAEDARGHVHHAFFKDAMLGRFYAICNCCSCCCGAMHAHQNGVPMLASSGYTAQVDEALCIGCETCVDLCQFSALELDGYTAFVDPEACMGCGICVSACEQDAITLERTPEKGEPLEIFKLMEQASLA